MLSPGKQVNNSSFSLFLKIIVLKTLFNILETVGQDRLGCLALDGIKKTIISSYLVILFWSCPGL